MSRRSIQLLLPPALIVTILSLCCLLKPADRYSASERRLLAQPPSISFAELCSGKYMTEAEASATDQFPFRDHFRSLNAVFSRCILRKKDHHGLYYQGGHLSKLDTRIRLQMLDYAAERLQNVYDMYLSQTSCRSYFAIIPDKNHFLAHLYGYPTIEHAELVQEMTERLPFVSYIEIKQTLTLDSFYRTDPHWRQECLISTAQLLADSMQTKLSAQYETRELNAPFYGAYYGQAALPVKPDRLFYLTDPLMLQCKVTSYDSGTPRPSAVYDLDKAYGRDPYEMFLSGSDALLVIENPNANTEKELILFRDSFASSLAPLLCSGYSRITLVDLRYIRSEVLRNYIEFDDQDVLFLYSTMILNNSLSLKS